MIRGRAPHAVLLVGPPGVGKVTLATDLAAGLLCTAEPLDARPCGACRSCRLVGSGSHADLHRLGPEGPGRQVVIGGPGAKARGVRDLIAELALASVEGGPRIGIIEDAHRMNEDAQSALLKTLEEPPAGVTLVLCADAEEPLLPTIRSRCARLRLGAVGPRDVEAILAGQGIADPATAARLARLTDGRPGLALAWARDAEALRVRDQIARVLLDLVDARPADRLGAVRSAVVEAAGIVRLLDAPRTGDSSAPATARARRGQRGASPSTNGAVSESGGEPGPDDAGDDASVPTRTPAAERRRAAEVVIAIWTDVARDLALGARGLDASLRDQRLGDETRAVAATLDPDVVTAFLDRLGRAAVLLAGNVSPDLLMDDIALASPGRATVAA